MFSHFGIKLAKVAANLRVPIARGNFFQNRGGLGQMLSQRIGQCLRAPQKHAAVPEIISGCDEFGRTFSDSASP